MYRIKSWGVWGIGSVLLLLLLMPAIASAHTDLLRSDPPDGAVLDQSPQRVRLTFNEPIEPDFFALEVYNQNRARVDRRDVRIPADDVAGLEVSLPPLPTGTYTIIWRVLSVDSHVVRGTLAFSVGSVSAGGPLLDLPQSSVPFGLAATVRWWTFLFAFVLVGGLGFMPLVLQPAFCAAGITDPVAARRGTRQFVWIAWPAVVFLLLLSFAALVLQAAEATGVLLNEVFGGRAISRLLFGTKYGSLWLARLGLLLGLLAIVAAISVETQPRRWIRSLGLALGAGLLLTISATGHASAVPRGTAVAVTADWIHLIAGSIWVGGLVQLVLALFPILKMLDAAQRRALLGPVIRRFSMLAGASVVALIATGTYSGLLHVPSWQAFLDTTYGAAFSGKLLLFLPILGLAAINLLVLHPRFVRAAKRQDAAQDDAGGVRWFRRLVLGEVILAVLVLAVTGILTGLPPATTQVETGGPFTATQPIGDLNATLSITPNQAGANELEMTVTDASGRPVAADAVVLSLRNRQMDMGQREVRMEQVVPGRYQASGNFLSMAGPWQADVRVRRADQEEQTGTVFVEVGQAANANRVAFSPARIVWNALTPVTLIGVVALAFAALVLTRRANLQKRARRDAGLLGLVMLTVGGVGTYSGIVGAYRTAQPNPIPATAASIARGQDVFAKNCAQCHGATGGGDGPAAFTMNPRPANLQYHMAQGHTDQDLQNWIANGIDGTAMPAFKGTLSEEEIWHVINKIRTFAPNTATK